MAYRFLVDSALRLSAMAASAASLLIVTYHRIPDKPDPLLPSEPHEEAFRFQMAFLARHLRPLLLPEAVDRLYGGSLPARAVCITFDDGYANNHEVALPVLRRLGIPATFFIATGYLDGGLMFNDGIIEAVRRSPRQSLELSSIGLGTHSLESIDARRRVVRALISSLKYRPHRERASLVAQVQERAEAHVPDNLMMTTAQIRALHASGMDVGGHTISHPILTQLPDDEANREIAQGRSDLTRILGTAPRSFAYPNGHPGEDFESKHAAMVAAAGYSYALSTVLGCARPTSDRWQIPRVTLWSRTVPRLTANLVSLYAKSR